MPRRRELVWAKVPDGWYPLCPVCRAFYFSPLFEDAIDAIFDAYRGPTWSELAKRGIERFHAGKHPNWVRMD